MPTYSLAQILNKSITVKNATAVYSAGDLNFLGEDKVKPALTLQKGSSFVCYSWIAPKVTPKISRYYLTAYFGSNYMAIPIVEGNFDIKSLQDQGVLTVKEQAAQEVKDNDTSLFGTLGLKDTFKDLLKGFKPILIIALVIVVIVVLMPLLMKAKSK